MSSGGWRGKRDIALAGAEWQSSMFDRSVLLATACLLAF